MPWKEKLGHGRLMSTSSGPWEQVTGFNDHIWHVAQSPVCIVSGYAEGAAGTAVCYQGGGKR